MPRIDPYFPRLTLSTRAELAAATLTYDMTEVHVTRFAAGGPPVDMVYSLESTDQTSTDPTSMVVNVQQSNGTIVTKYTHLRNAKVTPAMMGAPYDGTSDDAFAIQRAITYFGNCYPDRSVAAAIIKSPIKMVANSILDMTNGPVMKVDLSVFTNQGYKVTGGEYSDTACPIQAFGAHDATGSDWPVDVPLDNITILGCRLTPLAFVDGRRTNVICAINVTNLTIRNNEIYGFCVGSGISLTSCKGGKQDVIDNYVHDFYSNYAWGDAGSAQTTGIQVDLEHTHLTINGVHATKDCYKSRIVGNRIDSLTKGSTAINAVGGKQTDGVNIGADHSNSQHLIIDNHITNVDEGIDCFASLNTISGNKIDTVTVGIKLIHSASYNKVSSNFISEGVSWGIVLIANAVNEDCIGNHILGNTIRMATSNIDTTHQTACVLAYGNSTTGSHVDKNILQDNIYDPGSASTVIINQIADAATGKLRSKGDAFLAPGQDATCPWVSPFGTLNTKPTPFASENGYSPSLVISSPVNKTNARSVLGADWVKTTTAAETVPFNTVTFDELGEIVGSPSYGVLVHLPGYYRVTIVLKSTTWPAGADATLSIYRANTSNLLDQVTQVIASSGHGSVSFVTEIFMPSNSQLIFAQLALSSVTSTTIIGNAAGSFMIVEKV